MRGRALYIYLFLVMCVAGIALWTATRVRVASEASAASYLPNWSPKAASEYLDRREVWWQYWPEAQMDHATICISCHTVVPYSMIRPVLGQALHETEMPATEKILMGNVEKRVGNWDVIVPFYSDAVDGPGKTAESHATEAVLNAVILASYDTQHGQLRPITRTALNEAWALQEKSGDSIGSWKWQDFNLSPWESAESGYQGATMLMLTVENAPEGYASLPEVREHLELLREYLRKRYVAQPLLNQVYILWLSSKVPGLLSDTERKTLLEKIRNHQQANGGWSLSSLDPRSQLESDRWQRLKQQLIEVAKPAGSDGYATGLVVVALEESHADPQGDISKRGLKWLRSHQTKDGSWRASSINANRDPHSDVGRFMSDAATAYAVMALETSAGRGQENKVTAKRE